jgi:molecular chaperone GrpE (heat shock protein)
MALSKKNKPVRKTAVKVPATRKPLKSGRQPPQTAAPKAAKAVMSAPVPGEALAALTAEVAAVKARLLKEQETAPLGSDEEYDALRRLVNDLLERRMERVVRDLVEIRNAACMVAGAEAVAQALDAVLERVGAVRFEGQRLDHVDPLIHAVSRETHELDLPDGVIAASVRSGFRTARGVILAKAQVAVNRRT